MLVRQQKKDRLLFLTVLCLLLVDLVYWMVRLLLVTHWVRAKKGPLSKQGNVHLLVWAALLRLTGYGLESLDAIFCC